jgi:hypothetical protein
VNAAVDNKEEDAMIEAIFVATMIVGSTGALVGLWLVLFWGDNPHEDQTWSTRQKNRGRTCAGGLCVGDRKEG